MNRNIIGVDVNDVALERCREKTNFEHEGANGKVYLKKGDARNLSFISNEHVDLICTPNFSGYKYCNRSHQTSGCCCSQYQIRKAC